MLEDANGEYDTALVWSCEHIASLTLGETLWILSRERTISNSEYNTMVSYANSVGIDTNELDLIDTERTDCQPVD